MVANKNIFLNTVIVAAVFGPVALLWLGFSYDILSRRALVVGTLVWLIAFLLLLIWRKLTAKKNLPSSAAPGAVIDGRTGRRILRGVWINKVWIGLLAVCLPIGIADGVVHHDWGPILVGIVVNLLFMRLALQQIRRQRKRLDSACK